MGIFLRHWRIGLTTLLSTALVVAAFLYTRQDTQTSLSARGSSESVLLAAITKKDSDGDGLPDWQEALYGTDPHIVDTFHLGMTDGEAVAKGLIVPKAISDIPAAVATSSVDANGLPAPAPDGTLSAAFSDKFTTLYLAAKQAKNGGDLSQSELSGIASSTIATLSSVQPTPDFKSGIQLKISGSGPAALKAFAISAEQVMATYKTTATKDPVSYLTDALQNEDTSALTKLASAAKTGREVGVGLAAIPVPIELASADLALINAQIRLSEVINDFANSDSDPMTALLALQQYFGIVEAYGTAYIAISEVYKTAHVTFAPGEPGERFVNVIDDITARQKQAANIKP